MSEATRRAIHEAIAAHIEDERDDKKQLLTEWVIVASTALVESADKTGYWYEDSELPPHHAVGLLRHGLDTANAWEPSDDCD